MNYDLKSPCKNCPFRTDVTPYLRQERAEDIVEGIVDRQGTFTCHKTTVESEDDDGLGERVDGPNAQHCAGALILLEKIGRPNQMMRIAHRLGMYDPDSLNMDAPVFDDEDEFIEAQL